MRPLVVLIATATLLVACTPQATPPTAPTVAEISASPSVIPSAPSPVASSPPTPSVAVTAVRFATAQHGWIGVEDGILVTDDGGQTWSRQLTAGRVTKIWSYDATRAWARSADGTIYRTRDGRAWSALAPTTPPIAEIDPFSPDLVWAIGVAPTSGPQPAPQIGSVLVSDDGGSIWRPIGTHTMWSVCFYSRVDGFGAEGKQILRTADGGRTWVPIATLQINDNGPWYPTLSCPRETSFRVQVTEPYAALGHAPYLVLRTTDAGNSWELEYREGYTLGTTTPQNVPELGSYPSIIGVLPGGSTWFITCSPPVAVQDFLVLDRAGAVLAKERAPFVSCARDASFVDAQRGWAVDVDYQLTGTQQSATTRVMRTTDGSRTWERVYPP